MHNWNHKSNTNYLIFSGKERLILNNASTHAPCRPLKIQTTTKKTSTVMEKKKPFLVTRCLPFLFRSNEVGTVTPSTHGSLPTTSTRCFWSAASGRMWSWLGVGGHAQDDKSLNLYKGQSGCDGRFRRSGLGLTQFRAKVSVAVNLLCVFIFSFPKSIRCWAFTPVSVASRLQHISQTLMF